ncbi:S24 family peptidase [Brucella tritici]|uniref:S24 family peptidase n=1 Tax=Brucella tritici TaxID=94626 RepID=UPI00200072DE|nr:S24 family peptidase [Brucella tritici]
MNMDKVRDLIVKTAEAKGISLKMLSEQIGKNQTYIQQFITKGSPRELRERDRAAVAAILGLNDDDLKLPPEEISQARSTSFNPVIIPGNQLVSNNKGLPIYASAKGGDGHLIVTFDPIDYMKMPSVLQNVKGGYGLLITGDSMVPAYRPGETALVNPNLPPTRDEDIILYHTNDMNENEAIIKRLVGFNDREWTLEQYNPFEQFKAERVDWPVCHRVVGKYNTR